jgi:hypothetical protein
MDKEIYQCAIAYSNKSTLETATNFERVKHFLAAFAIEERSLDNTENYFEHVGKEVYITVNLYLPQYAHIMSAVHSFCSYHHFFWREGSY